MSKFKDLTADTPPSFSGAGTEEEGQQSLLYPKTDNTPTSTESTNPPSQPMLSDVTTGKVTEITRQHALVARVALLYLLKIGLVKRYKVLSAEGTAKEIQIVFDPSVWNEELELLS